MREFLAPLVPGDPCPICGAEMIDPKVRQNHRHGFSRDHILPRIRGGAACHEICRNIRIMCRSCNENLASACHCIAALRCARDVSADTGETLIQVMREWGYLQQSARHNTKRGQPGFAAVFSDPPGPSAMAEAFARLRGRL